MNKENRNSDLPQQNIKSLFPKALVVNLRNTIGNFQIYSLQKQQSRKEINIKESVCFPSKFDRRFDAKVKIKHRTIKTAKCDLNAKRQVKRSSKRLFPFAVIKKGRDALKTFLKWFSFGDIKSIIERNNQDEINVISRDIVKRNNLISFTENCRSILLMLIDQQFQTICNGQVFS